MTISPKNSATRIALDRECGRGRMTHGSIHARTITMQHGEAGCDWVCMTVTTSMCVWGLDQGSIHDNAYLQ